MWLLIIDLLTDGQVCPLSLGVVDKRRQLLVTDFRVNRRLTLRYHWTFHYCSAFPWPYFNNKFPATWQFWTFYKFCVICSAWISKRNSDLRNHAGTLSVKRLSSSLQRRSHVQELEIESPLHFRFVRNTSTTHLLKPLDCPLSTVRIPLDTYANTHASF